MGFCCTSVKKPQEQEKEDSSFQLGDDDKKENKSNELDEKKEEDIKKSADHQEEKKEENGTNNDNKNEITNKEDTKEEPKPQKEEEEKKEKNKKYKFKKFKENNVIVPNDYQTDDKDEYTLITLLNQGPEGYEFIKEEDGIKVYQKADEDCKDMMLFTYVEFPYSFDIVKKTLIDDNPKWNKKAFEGSKKLSEKKEDNYLEIEIYSLMPFPFPMTDRETLTRKKIWFDHAGIKNTLLMHSKSIKREDYPIKEKPIRANMKISGYYIKEISPNKCQLIMVNSMDLKITTGASFVKSAAPGKSLESMKQALEYCKKLKKK